MDIHTLFDDKSDVYAKSRPQYPVQLYDWLVVNCNATDAVWDVGCGNGQASIDLKKHFELVQATDVSASQIENAPSIDGVTFSVQKAEQTNFADHAFDAVCVAQALHWFDYDCFWPEVMRVLRPNGTFCAWGYSWPCITPDIDAILETSFLSTIRPYWPAQNKLLWDGYIDVPFPFKHRLKTPSIALTMTLSIEEFYAYLHSWSATRRCMEQIGDSFFKESFDEIRPLWGPNIKQGVTMDLVIIAGKN